MVSTKTFEGWTGSARSTAVKFSVFLKSPWVQLYCTAFTLKSPSGGSQEPAFGEAMAELAMLPALPALPAHAVGAPPWASYNTRVSTLRRGARHSGDENDLRMMTVMVRCCCCCW